MEHCEKKKKKDNSTPKSIAATELRVFFFGRTLMHENQWQAMLTPDSLQAF